MIAAYKKGAIDHRIKETWAPACAGEPHADRNEPGSGGDR